MCLTRVSGGKKMYQSINMSDFYQMTKKSSLATIDVREKNEYESGHVKGSIHLPLSQLGEIYEILDKETKYYVICRTGSRSAMACDFLSEKGYTMVNVLGGMCAWKGQEEGVRKTNIRLYSPSESRL